MLILDPVRMVRPLNTFRIKTILMSYKYLKIIVGFLIFIIFAYIRIIHRKKYICNLI